MDGRLKMRSGMKKESSRKTGLDYMVGIDTGGTYTDGVLLDYGSREVISSSKTLTTPEDLTYGITAALDGLALDGSAHIKLVCISSTLATNSIAEGKGRRVGLLLIGYDRDLVLRYDLEKKFPTPHFAYFPGGHTVEGEEKEPLNCQSIVDWVRKNQDNIDALAISSYFSPLNSTHEEEAFEAVREISSLPVVLGHQLSTRLDSIRRATTACLNASLVAIMQEFIEAVRASLKAHDIEAPLMIVKGDGSLMPDEMAGRKPVETILSGPAASAMGGKFLSGYPDAVVIDIGGTTTDIALLEDSQIAITEDGARVGEMETAIRAGQIRTIGLGGDSRLSFHPDGQITIGPSRVVPLSYLSARFPRVEKELVGLRNKPLLDWQATDLEYWFSNRGLRREAAGVTGERQRHLIELLDEGPLSLTQILEKFDLFHPMQLGAEGLVRQGFVQQSSLTPTDLLHVNGQFTAWSTKAARAGLDVACVLFEKKRETLVEDVLHRMATKIVEEVVVFLGQKMDRGLPGNVGGPWGQWLLRQATGGVNPYLEVDVISRFPIIGIGAPAEIFLKRVAGYLKTSFFLPPYAHVANAVGAVAGSVMVVKEALVFPHGDETVQGFHVQVEGKRAGFEELDGALVYARDAAAEEARVAALSAGADDPQVLVDVCREGAYFRVVAKALGNPRLSW
jgi:N-methylhydantoinase A/oxoprolinase/acetone carboxylase beta subunit